MRRATDAIGCSRDAVHDDRLGAEDLRRVTFVEVQRDATHDRRALGERPRRVLELRAILHACAMNDERHEHTGPVVSSDFAEVDGAQRSRRRRIERRERPAVRLVERDSIAKQRRDLGDGSREDLASRDVDDLMASALCIQSEPRPRRNDELRSRAVLDDRLGGLDGLGVDELERGITRSGLHDAAALQCELLAVGEADDGTTSATIGVIADHTRVVAGL